VGSYRTWYTQLGGTLVGDVWSIFHPIICLFDFLWRKHKEDVSLKQGFFWAGGILLALWVLSILFGFLIAALPQLGDLFLGSLGLAGSEGLMIQEVVRRRFISLGWVTLLVLLAFTLSLLFTKNNRIDFGTTDSNRVNESWISRYHLQFRLMDLPCC